MNYYVVDTTNNDSLLFDTDKAKFQSFIRIFKPELQGQEIQETDREIIELDGKFVFADEHQEEISQQEQTKADAEAQVEFQETIAAIKDDMVSALLSDDVEWQQELKEEYQSVLNGSEEEGE